MRWAVAFFSLVWTLSVWAGEAAPSDGGAIRPQTLDSSMREITRHRDDDLAAICQQAHCAYDFKTNKVTCDEDTPPHRKMRCRNILWSAQMAADRRYEGCKEFLVGDKGNLGEMGHVVMDAIVADIEKNGSSSPFLQNNDNYTREPDDKGRMHQLCPGFNRFDDVTKAQFYLYLMENIAYREVSCEKDPKENRNAPTTTAVCTYQLELGLENRKIRPKSCQVSDAVIQTPEGCGRCAVDMMADELRAPEVSPGEDQYYLAHKPFGTINQQGKLTSRSYWQSMNPDTPGFLRKWKGKHLPPHEALMNDIRYFPPCRDSITEPLNSPHSPSTGKTAPRRR